MKELLDQMLPRIFPSLRFLCIPHEGKADLDSHIRSKLSSWRVPGDSFIINAGQRWRGLHRPKTAPAGPVPTNRTRRCHNTHRLPRT